MAKIFSPIKQRINLFIDNQSIVREDFYKLTGISSSNFKGNGAKSELGGEKIVNILTAYPTLNSEWLLTGIGKMLKSDSIAAEEQEPYGRIGLPLIPIEVAAGFGNGEIQVMDYEAERYVIPEFKELKVDFLIRVTGPSMFPTYSQGDIVGCRKHPLDTFFRWNQVYVLDTKQQGAIIKRVNKSKDEEVIICVSDNELYKPFELPLSELNGLALVVGSISLV